MKDAMTFQTTQVGKITYYSVFASFDINTAAERPGLTNVMLVVAGGNTRPCCLVEYQYFEFPTARKRRLSYLLQGANMPASF